MLILPATCSPEAEQARKLARLGKLAQVHQDAGAPVRSALRTGMQEIAAQVIFQQVSLPVERRRRHDDCSRGVPHLRADCLDRFHDAVEALVNRVLLKATAPILNLDAWMAASANTATIDDHRTRRGLRGAQQRPYVTQWLRAELHDDPWLVDLALAILTWVGITDTAGAGVWPVDAWADRRARVTGDHMTSDSATVRREIEIVLNAMRRKESWYVKYILRPLECKPIAVAPTVRTWCGQPVDPAPLSLVSSNEQQDGALLDLAALCLDAIRVGILERGLDPDVVVVEAIRRAFGHQLSDLTLHPHVDSGPDVHDTLSDPASVNRIVRTVLEILYDQGGASRRGRVS